jgi:hypothetical protein
VLPGNPALVHHVLLMPVDLERVVDGGKTNGEVMQEMDDASPDRAGCAAGEAQLPAPRPSILAGELEDHAGRRGASDAGSGSTNIASP